LTGVAVVLVAYEPELPRLGKTLAALAACANEVLVFDNSVSTGMAARVRELCAAVGAVYLGGRGNLGIGAAQNEAIACVSRSDRVLFLDQDSAVSPEFVRSLCASFDRLRGLDPHAGFLGPVPVDEKGVPYALQEVAPFHEYIRVDWLISSGSMVLLDDLREVGGMRSDLFIDLVDSEICWRMRARGFSSYVDPGIRFEHPIGAGALRRFLGRPIVISAPARNYYQVRNPLLLGRDGVLPLPAALRRVLMRLGAVLVSGLLAGRLASRVAHAARGLRDGILGRGGPFR
jgi:rhamnosyltransferase